MTEPNTVTSEISGSEMDPEEPTESDIERVSVQVTGFQCQDCDHSWTPRYPDPPKVCPECKSYEWDENGGGEVSFDGVECQRCGECWAPRGDDLPLVCHSCKRYDWWTEGRDPELHQAYRDRT